MAQSHLEELRRIVLEHTVKINAPVANIFGAAQATVAAITTTTHSSWLLLQQPGADFPTVDAFYQAYAAAASPTRSVVETDDGVVVGTSATSEVSTFLFKGTVTVDQTRNFPFAVDVGSAQATFLVAVDGRTLKTGTAGAELRISLDPGTHVIEVLGKTRTLALKAPADLQVTALLEQPDVPVWQAVTTGYLDPAAGTSVATLAWYVDPKVGGWRVLRRELEVIELITAVSAPDTSGVCTIAINGDVSALVTVGLELMAGAERMGTVLSVVYDTTDLVTNVRLRLASGRTDTSPNWVGRSASTGSYTEIARLTRTVGAGVMSWSDTNVTFGNYYEYALQAFGFFDPTAWSAVSDPRDVRAGDNEAPASIILDATYPRVIDALARVKFTTPSDADYAGVRVYYRQVDSGTVTAATATTATNTAATFTPSALIGRTIRITGGTGVGQERLVTANTATQVTVDAAWLTTPDTTSEYSVFTDSVIKTDYGLPNATDDFSFEPIDATPTGAKQLYHFRAFDTAGNEQTDADCETWEFNPADDVLSGAPYAKVVVTLQSSTATTVTLQVTASSSAGTPKVRWNYTDGGATKVTGAELQDVVAIGATWTFNRPTTGQPNALVGFEAYLAGIVTDADEYTIPAQGQSLNTVAVNATEVSATATQVVVSVTATDANNAGATVTLTVFDQTGIPSAITPTTITGTGTATQLYTIARPPVGASHARVTFKGHSSVAGVSDDYDWIDIIPNDTDTRYCQCFPKIVATDATTVTVRVDADSNTGTPQVELIEVLGSATRASGAATNTLVAAGSQWVFNRGAINSGSGQAHFRAKLEGYEDDDAFIPVEEQGRDTVILGIKLKAITTQADRVVVRCYVIDPYPQGANTVTLSYESQGTGAITPPGVLTLTPTASYATTGFLDFTVFRPGFALGDGHFVVTAAAANREPAVDSIVVPCADQDSQPCVCKAAITSFTKDTCTVTVTATHPTGTPQVELVGISGPITLASGTTAGTFVAQNGTSNVWVFNRGGVDAGIGQAQFRAHVASTTTIPAVDDDDFVEIADKGQDTRGLVISLESVGSTTTTETVRVKVIDPNPQGANTVTVQYFASGTGTITPASGQTLTPTNDLTTTGSIDFTINRASLGSDQGTVKFLATCANRISDADSCFVTAQRQTSFGPSLDVKPSASLTDVTFTYTATGTLTYSINGATPVSVPASPFSRNRPAVNAHDDTYTFICLKDGQTIQDTVVVSSKGDIPDLVITPGASDATTATYTISATNRGGGTAPTISMTLGGGLTASGYVGAGPFTLASPTTVVFNRLAFGSGTPSATIVASIAGGGSETDKITVQNKEQDTQYVECKARVISSTKTQCTVQVDATSPTGTPTVALIATTAPATVASRPVADGTFTTSGSQWTFNLGDYNATGTVGMAQFRAQATGLQTDDDLVVLATQATTPSLDISAHVSTQDAVSVTVQVTVADPYPQGAGTITLTVPSIVGTGVSVKLNNSGGAAVTTGSSFTVDPGSTTTFYILRPDFGFGKGGVQWKAHASGRTDDFDAVVLAEKLRDTVPLRVAMTKMNYDSVNSKWQVWYKFYSTNVDGSETEHNLTGTWLNYATTLTITDVNTGSAATGVSNQQSGSYTLGADGWLVSWTSSNQQAWSFHGLVGEGGQSWNGTRINPTVGASLNLSVPSAAANSAFTSATVGSTTTGSPGSSASVSVSNSGGVATFNFTVPQGPTGAPGSPGSTGPQGPSYPVTISSGTPTGTGVIGQLWIQF